ncbi:hypothetical protein ABJY94_18495 [Vibrio parahaemolyticus]|uniref:hypothetical protein n=1 Tax=Vibrio parahaemolyticus TaxID=670 RepID=UPI0032AFC873
MKKSELKDLQLCQDISYKSKVIVRILSDANSGMPHVTVVSGNARMQSYITDRDNLKPV